MLRLLVSAADRLLRELAWSLRRGKSDTRGHALSDHPSRPCRPLRSIQITDGVSRTLFEEFAAHRDSSCGEEETGWLLMGYRQADDAIVLATLPAGTQRDAGVSHVQFNTLGQAVGARMVRQSDRGLMTLGVVHTHPGSLRHPSDGDYRGDSQWIGQLRGQEGIFGIGTADAAHPDGFLGRHPKPNVQTLGKLCFSWYRLRHGEGQYRPLPVELVLGPDLARTLHPVWAIIEAHAAQLDRLATQQAGVKFELVEGKAALVVTIPLVEPECAIRVHLEGNEVRYLLLQRGEYFLAETREPQIDQGVYHMLAELAYQA